MSGQISSAVEGGIGVRARFAVLVATVGVASFVSYGYVAAADTDVAEQGSWQVTAHPSPVRAVHTALLKNGKVLLVSGSGNNKERFAAGTFETSIWDPATDTFEAVDTPWDAFCAGHAFLPDGRLLVAGGTTAYPSEATQNRNAGSKESYVFDPTSRSYEKVADQTIARWYPTLTEMGDGRILVVGGLDESGVLTKDWQLFDGVTQRWTELTTPPSAFRRMPMYPALHLMRDGRLFYSGVNTFGSNAEDAPAGIWNTRSNGFQHVAGLTDADRRDQGASLLLPPAQDQKVMVIGGGWQEAPVWAVPTTAIVDLSKENPTFTAGPLLDYPKMYVNATILPDQTVLQTGGSLTTVKNGNHPVLTAQIFDPKTNIWETVAPPTVPRAYHSSSLLLPDGRVATFGGNPLVEFEMRIEIFRPGYLQTGQERPSIDSSPTEIHYGETFSVGSTQAAPIESAVLVLPAAITHSSDPNQRLVDLPFSATSDGVTVTVPNEPNLAPPGWYMMFLVDVNGVPSEARWVHLNVQTYEGGGYTLDGWGGMHPFATNGVSAPPVTSAPYWRDWDIARGATLKLDHTGGYIVDGWGGLHPFATAGSSLPSPVTSAPYWPGWDIVRGVALLPNGTGGYVLDGWGGLHPFRVGDGSAPPTVSGAPYWSGKDVARGVALDADGSGGYIVDTLGRVHPFSMGNRLHPPRLDATPYASASVPVRGIALSSDGSGGMVLDGWGGRHMFGIGGADPGSTTGGAYWLGWNIARGVVR